MKMKKKTYLTAFRQHDNNVYALLHCRHGSECVSVPHAIRHFRSTHVMSNDTPSPMSCLTAFVRLS